MKIKLLITGIGLMMTACGGSSNSGSNEKICSVSDLLQQGEYQSLEAKIIDLSATSNQTNQTYLERAEDISTYKTSSENLSESFPYQCDSSITKNDILNLTNTFTDSESKAISNAETLGKVQYTNGNCLPEVKDLHKNLESLKSEANQLSLNLNSENIQTIAPRIISITEEMITGFETLRDDYAPNADVCELDDSIAAVVVLSDANKTVTDLKSKLSETKNILEAN